jgi:hypothetical protein
VREAIRELFTAYYESLDDSRKRLLSRYRFVDVAHKVVGVGSVGTRCFISFWQGVDDGDPLFLQVKQARTSLLEPYLGRSEYAHSGQRVITGQRLMQATNDIFLGYGQIGEETYFIRQLYDMKGQRKSGNDPRALPEAVCRAVRRGASPRPCAQRRRGANCRLSGQHRMNLIRRWKPAQWSLPFQGAAIPSGDWKSWKVSGTVAGIYRFFLEFC